MGLLSLFRFLEGFFPPFPFGTSFTDEEITLGKSLREFKEKAAENKMAILPKLAGQILSSVPVEAKPYLERMKLDNPSNRQEKMMQKVVILALKQAGHRADQQALVQGAERLATQSGPRPLWGARLKKALPTAAERLVGPRVSSLICLAESSRTDVRVDLGGGDTGMSEQFLHLPQVGATRHELPDQVGEDRLVANER